MSASRSATTSSEPPEALAQAPAPRRRDRLAPLASLIELGLGEFTLATVQYDRPGQRQRIIARLREALPDRTLAQVSLQDPALSYRNLPAQLFEALARRARERAGSAYDAVLLVDWEKRLEADLPTSEQPPTSLTGPFNMGRDIVAETFPCPVLVFLPGWALATVQSLAADFISWRSGVFVFPSEPEAAKAALRDALAGAQNGDGEASADLRRRLASALADVQAVAGDSAASELIPRSLSCLADLAPELDDPAEAAMEWERLARWAELHDAEPWRERAERGRRRVARRLPRDAAVVLPAGDWWRVFRGASALTPEDTILGREADLDRILEMVLDQQFRCGTVWGETGCGKTSLIRAGLEPALRSAGHLPVYVNSYRRLSEELRLAVAAAAGLAPPPTLRETLQAAVSGDGATVVLLCDQFEQLYGVREAHPGDVEAFLRELSDLIDDLGLAVRFVFLVRADHLWRLIADFDRLGPVNHPLEVSSRYELRWLRRHDAERVLALVGEQAGAGWPEELIEEVIDELNRGGRVKPVEVQLIAAGLYLRGIVTPGDYRQAGGAVALLKDYLNAVLDTVGETILARRLLRALVIPTEPPMRAALRIEEVARAADASVSAVRPILEALEAPHVVTSRGDEDGPARVELVHDVLIEPALRASTPQEIGLHTLRTALAKQRRLLGPRQYWRIGRSDLSELPEALRRPARNLLRRSLTALIGAALATLLVLLVGIVNTLQSTSSHFYVDDDHPAQPILLRRGLPAFANLPEPLGSEALADTGFSFVHDSSPRQRAAIEALRPRPWHGSAAKIDGLLPFLDSEAEGRWRCCVGQWSEGLRLSPPSAAIDPDSAVPILVELLDTEDSSFRLTVLRSLTGLSIPDHYRGTVIESLVTHLLERGDSESRNSEFLTLAELEIPAELTRLLKLMGHTGASYAAVLVERLASEDAQIRSFAASLAQQSTLLEVPIRAEAEELLPGLGEREPVFWLAMASAFRDLRLGSSGSRALVPNDQLESVVATLIENLNSGDPDERLEAAAAVPGLSIPPANASAVIAALLPHLKTEAHTFLGSVLEALASLPISPAEADHLVEGMIAYARLQTRVPALRVYPLPPATSDFVVSALLRRLQNPFFNARVAAMRRLDGLPIPEARADAAIACIIDLLGFDQNKFYSMAQAMLANLAVPANRRSVLIHALLDRLEEPEEVREMAQGSLSRLALPESHRAVLIEALTKSLGDKDPQIISGVTAVFMELARAEPTAIGEHRQPLVQRLPANQITSVIEALADNLENDQPEVSSRSAATLGYLFEGDAYGPTPIDDKTAGPVIETLNTLLGSREIGVRVHAAAAILRSSQRAPKSHVDDAVSTLVETLDLQMTQSPYVYEPKGRGVFISRRRPNLAIDVLQDLPIPEDQIARVIDALLAVLRIGDTDYARSVLARLGNLPATDDQISAAIRTTIEMYGSVSSTRRFLDLSKLSKRQAVDEHTRDWLTALLRHESDLLRNYATTRLGDHFLETAQKESDTGAWLLGRLGSDASRLDARYRRAVVRALALWYRAGRAATEKASETAESEDAVAIQPPSEEEFARLEAALRELRKTGPAWIRPAACEVWTMAAALRSS